MNTLMAHIIVSYAIGAGGAIANLIHKAKAIYVTSVVAMALGFVVHTYEIGNGIARDGHLPLYGVQEVTSFLGWALVLYFLLVQFRYPSGALAGLLFPTATVLTFISLRARAVDRTPVALADSPLLFSIHAGLVLLGYAAFFMVFMASVLYIVQEREIKGKRFGAIFHRLPSLDTCDSIGFRALVAGLVLLTLGIVSGMVWSQRQYGSLWQGQPIEIFAVCTWLVYFGLVHYRIWSGLRGRRAAIVAILGFGLIIVSLAILRFSTGFHGS